MSETLTFFYHDHLGSVVGQEEFDSAGNLLDTKTNSYDLYGNPIDKINACFTGKYMDRTGLYYFNARYYDPKAGRFITEDPAKQGEGWYNYCSGNPLNRVDPDGRADMIAYISGDYMAHVTAYQWGNLNTGKKNIFSNFYKLPKALTENTIVHEIVNITNGDANYGQKSSGEKFNLADRNSVYSRVTSTFKEGDYMAINFVHYRSAQEKTNLLETTGSSDDTEWSTTRKSSSGATYNRGTHAYDFNQKLKETSGGKLKLELVGDDFSLGNATSDGMNTWKSSYKVVSGESPSLLSKASSFLSSGGLAAAGGLLLRGLFALVAPPAGAGGLGTWEGSALRPGDSQIAEEKYNQDTKLAKLGIDSAGKTTKNWW